MPPDRVPARRSPLILALTVALVAALLSTIAVLSVDRLASPQLSASAILALCPDDTDCQAEHVLDTIATTGSTPSTAQFLAGLELAEAIAAITQNGCHLLSHRLGEISYERYPDAVLGVHSEDCVSGFTHGWMLALTESLPVERSTARLAEYCRADLSEVGCVHGIGHAFGQQAMPPLRMEQLCIALTKRFPDTGSFRSPLNGCVAGWVMESAHPVQWSDDEAIADGLKLCAPLAGEAAATCDAMTYRRWVGSAGTPEPRIARFADHCRAVAAAGDELFGSICVGYYAESFGRDQKSPGMNLAASAERVNRNCNLPHADICVLGVITMISTELNGERGFIEQFCRKLEPEFAQHCPAS